MPFFEYSLADRGVREETNAGVIANLERKDWVQIPDPPEPRSTWDRANQQWIAPPPPPPDPVDFQGLLQDLLSDPAFTTVRGQAGVSTVVLRGYLGTAINAIIAQSGDATGGSVLPEPVLVQLMQGNVADIASVLTPAEKTRLQGYIDNRAPGKGIIVP